MTPAEVPQKWDHEADVIIVGGGTAGLPAAVIVAEAGLNTTLLEARPALGGSFNMVVGGFCAPGCEEQKAAGITDDSPDLFYEDLVNICGADPEIARAYADNVLDSYKMLVEEGVEFPGLIPLPRHSRRRVLGWLLGFGPKMVKAAEGRARRVGVEILTRHRALRLIVNPQTDRVIGLTVDTGGEIKNFRAKRAVILTSGGFGRNREMVAEYAPHMVNCVPKMPVSHLGDGLKMGMDAGAATKDMGIAVAGSWPVDVETHSECIWALDWGGIMVNVHGKRFHDESSSEGFYGRMTEAAMRQPGSVYWVVFNEDIMNNIGRIEGTDKRNMEHVKDVEKCNRIITSSLDELAEKAGINAEGLKEAIEKYNSDIDNFGYDTVCGRKHQMGEARPLAKITPPYYAIKSVTATTSMKGGLKINARGQVLNQYDETIPGLYAAGETTGGLHTKTYLLGIMSSSAFTQGIIAARNAVKEPAA